VVHDRSYNSPIRATTLADYNAGVGGDELCLVLADQILVQSGLATPQLQLATAIDAERALATRVVTPLRDLFVACVVHSAASPGTDLQVLSSDLSAVQVVDLYGQVPVGLTAHDAINPGFDDVFLMYEGKSSLEQMFNFGVLYPLSMPQFDYSLFAGIETVLDPGAVPGAGHNVRPVVTDLDGDGDGDFALGIHTSGELVLGYNGLHAPARPYLVDAQLTSMSLLDLQLEFAGPSGAPAGATHFELMAWPVTATAALTLEQAGTHRKLKALDPLNPNVVQSIDMDAAVLQNGGYAVIARFVALDAASQRVTRAHPALCFGYSTEDSGHQFKFELLANGPTLDVLEPYMDGGEVVGGITPLPYIPPPVVEPPVPQDPPVIEP